MNFNLNKPTLHEFKQIINSLYDTPTPYIINKLDKRFKLSTKHDDTSITFTSLDFVIKRYIIKENTNDLYIDMSVKGIVISYKLIDVSTFTSFDVLLKYSKESEYLEVLNNTQNVLLLYAYFTNYDYDQCIHDVGDLGITKSTTIYDVVNYNNQQVLDSSINLKDT
jgi:hypothetical protein